VRTATRSRLLKAGHEISSRQNPDNPEIATEKFKSVSEAYDALTKQPDEARGISFVMFDPSMFANMFNIPKRT
jgi:DnaJ-class molecular chaperone